MEIIVETPRLRISVESGEAKQNFTDDISSMMRKSEEITKNNYICGTCAAFSCFRNPSPSDRAGLCYQTERECRQECDSFLQDHESGKSPQFQITGTCKKDGQNVLYEQSCRFSK